MSKKVFIKTFGCQMNEYDSDKMADVMKAAEGYEPTQNVDEADLILFNTCSVRERAQEKVFSDLGRVKHLKERGVLIGVGGCVASQEGADIIKRAPYVDVVFGPQTLHRLPQLLDQSGWTDYRPAFRRNLHLSLHCDPIERIDYGLLFYPDPNTPSVGCPNAAEWLADNVNVQPPVTTCPPWLSSGTAGGRGPLRSTLL